MKVGGKGRLEARDEGWRQGKVGGKGRLEARDEGWRQGTDEGKGQMKARDNRRTREGGKGTECH